MNPRRPVPGGALAMLCAAAILSGRGQAAYAGTSGATPTPVTPAEPAASTAPAAPAAQTASATPAASAAPAASPASASSPSYSAAGLYNLANAYARAGRPGLAVLNYERARLLSPDDEDITSNEKHVRDALHLPTDVPDRFQRLVTALPPTATAWVGCFGVLLLGTALLSGTLSDRRRGLRRMSVSVGAAALALPVCQTLVLWPAIHSGVVITDATPVLVSPVPMGESLFTLPEAETVRMTGEHEGYVLIRTRTGRTGWISKTNFVPVVPRPGR